MAVMVLFAFVILASQALLPHATQETVSPVRVLSRSCHMHVSNTSTIISKTLIIIILVDPFVGMWPSWVEDGRRPLPIPRDQECRFAMAKSMSWPHGWPRKGTTVDALSLVELLQAQVLAAAELVCFLVLQLS